MPTHKTYLITPVSAPRQVKSDVWNPSDHVLRYRAFRDECALRGVTISPRDTSITFVLPMPASWSQKKKDAMRFMPHEQKPDLDNLIKALVDAAYRNADDGKVSSYGRTEKIWGDIGEIRITLP